eukprot:CAMPEP_0195285502 /NCGR_PEP_ID=MMETSP0707-20130614/3307_1 /TAXON_ID=33640 /ORGANISM="Asterionellopsis glacialis, Strain CCMP134" /LENGTH=167 /DNA_ID=CAMNT_0040344999 /DNA_START=504 /DNA_END=1007 /DNA_ORIENTATION=-
MCTDRSTQIDLDNFNTSCVGWDTFLGLVDESDGMDCEDWRRKVYAISNCSCLIDDTKIGSMKTIASECSDDTYFDGYSAQREALYWLAVQDPAKLNVSDDTENTIKELYVMALFYFSAFGATSLTDEFDFLSSKDICSWNDGEDQEFMCNYWDSVNEIKLSGAYIIV